MKYKITNKKDKTSKIVEARTVPLIDKDTHFVKRTREVVKTVTSNQRHRERRRLRILDDQGKEHKTGEIFESKTLSLEI